jgi:hypothetical protein
MKKWLSSLEGVLSLSVLALLTFLARIIGLDAMFVLPNEMGMSEDQAGAVALFMFGTMGLFGVWIWALLAAVRGGRRAMIGLLLLNLFTGLFGGLVSLLAFCQPRCAAPPVGNLIVWAELIIGLIASAAVLMHLISTRPSMSERLPTAS